MSCYVIFVLSLIHFGPTLNSVALETLTLDVGRSLLYILTSLLRTHP